jgi:hypothetical protein
MTRRLYQLLGQDSNELGSITCAETASYIESLAQRHIGGCCHAIFLPESKRRRVTPSCNFSAFQFDTCEGKNKMLSLHRAQGAHPQADDDDEY